MKTFVVIGLGRFGSVIAEELCNQGNEVLAIDPSPEAVQRIADKVTHAAVGDAQDPDVLRSLGVGNYDCGVVAFSSDIGASVLATLNLRDLGVQRIICKARNPIHQEVLSKIGADLVVIPEHESGRKLALSLTKTDILNFIELSEEYGIAEMILPPSWEQKSLRELDVRALYQLNIVAVRNKNGQMHLSPGAGYVFQAGDTVFALGQNENIDRVQKKR